MQFCKNLLIFTESQGQVQQLRKILFKCSLNRLLMSLFFSWRYVYLYILHLRSVVTWLNNIHWNITTPITWLKLEETKFTLAHYLRHPEHDQFRKVCFVSPSGNWTRGLLIHKANRWDTEIVNECRSYSF